MKGGNYVSLARNYSFILLLAVYVTVDGTLGFLPTLRSLYDARRAFATVIANEHPFPTNSTNTSYMADVHGLGATKLFRTYTNDRLADGLVATSLDKRQWQARDLGLNVRTNTGFFLDFSFGPSKPKKLAFDKARQQLRDIYQEQWRKEADTSKTSGSLFNEIEYGIFEKQVKVPLIDMEFRSHVATWVLSLIIIGGLIQIRHNARRTQFDPDLAIDEPWLLLDGRQGLERIVGLGWLLGIALAPWFGNACLFAVYAAQLQANGTIDSAWKEAGVSISCFVLTLVGGWSSLSATAELLRLRRLRLDRVAALSEAG